MSIFTILEKLPKAVDLASLALRVSQGDQEAAEKLRADGLYDLLDVALRPGAGAAGRRVLDGVQEMLGVETEPTDPRNPPWSGFIKRLLAQKSGGHIFLGMMGTGKTYLAVKLAYQWSLKNHYLPEWVGLYPEDVPDFGNKVHIDTLIHRMGCLNEYLKSEGVHDPEEDSYFMGQAG